jgi:SAM-dependent methyltransferase
MGDRERIARFFDGKAAAWDGIYSGDRWLPWRLWDQMTRQNLRHRFAFALEAVPQWQGQRVLDVGCGSGRHCVELARRGAAQVVGLDVSPRMLAMAEKLARRQGVAGPCRFARQDIAGFEDAAGFGVIIANGLFDYVRRPQDVLSRLHGLSRGSLIASFPVLWACRVPFRWAWLALHGCPVKFYTASEITRYCDAVGWVRRKLVRRGPIYLLLAERPQPPAEGPQRG